MATNSNDDLDQWALKETLGGGERGSDAPTSSTLPVRDATPPAAAAAPVAEKPKWEASVFQGFTPKHAMEGFDFNREQNTGKSAKDAFAYLSNQAPPPPINDKAALGQWFTDNIRPGMEALGHKVNSVEGDKFNFSNWQGDFDVDFGRGAGAEGGALAWQVDDGTAKMGSGPYVPKQNAVAQAALGAAIGGQPNVGEQDASSAQAQIQKEIDAAINGGQSPLEMQALLAQLQE